MRFDARQFIMIASCTVDAGGPIRVRIENIIIIRRHVSRVVGDVIVVTIRRIRKKKQRNVMSTNIFPSVQKRTKCKCLISGRNSHFRHIQPILDTLKNVWL